MVGRMCAVKGHHGSSAPTPQEGVQGVTDVVDAVFPCAYTNCPSVVQADRRADAERDERKEDKEWAEHCVRRAM